MGHGDPTILTRQVKEVMTSNPRRLSKGHLALEALKILRAYKIDEIPIVDSRDKPVGLLDIQDLLKAGLV